MQVLRLAPADPAAWALLPSGTPGLESAMAGEERAEIAEAMAEAVALRRRH